MSISTMDKSSWLADVSTYGGWAVGIGAVIDRLMRWRSENQKLHSDDTKAKTDEGNSIFQRALSLIDKYERESLADRNEISALKQTCENQTLQIIELNRRIWALEHPAKQGKREGRIRDLDETRGGEVKETKDTK